MKKQILIASLLASGLAFTAHAAEGDGKGKGEKKPAMTPEQRAETMIKNLDKDGDGKLDQAELAAQPVRPAKAGAPAPDKPVPTPEERAARMIKRGDKDADGKLDKAELVALLQAGPPRPGGGAPKKKPDAQ